MVNPLRSMTMRQRTVGYFGYIAIYLTIVVLSSILLIGSLVGWVIARSSIAQYEAQATASLARVSQVIDGKLDQVNAIASLLANDSTIYDVLSKSNLKEARTDLAGIQPTLSNVYNSSPTIVDSIYVYYGNLDVIQSTTVGVQPTKEFGDINWMPFIRNAHGHGQWLIRDIGTDRAFTPSITLILPLPISASHPVGAIIINVNTRLMLQSVPAIGHQNLLWMIAPSGSRGLDVTNLGVISHTTVSHLPHMNLGQSMTLDQSYKDLSYHFNDFHSPDTGWTYAEAIPNHTFFILASKTLEVVGLACGISFLISFLLALRIAKQMYSPVRQLIQSSEVPPNTPIDSRRVPREFRMLLTTLSKLRQSTSTLERQLHEQSPILVRDALMRLLQGDVTWSEFDNECQRHGISLFDGEVCFVAVIKSDTRKELAFSQLVNDVTVLARSSLIGISKSINTIQRSDEIIFLASLDHGLPSANLRHNLMTAMRQINVEAAESLHLILSIGVGDLVTIERISESYRQALIALNTSLFNGFGQVSSFWNLDTKRRVNHGILAAKSKFLADIDLAIKSRDSNRLEEAIRDVLRFFQTLDLCPITIIQSMFLDLCIGATQSAIEVGYEAPLELDLFYFYDEVRQRETVDSLVGLLRKTALDVIAELKTKLTRHRESEVKKMVDYIHQTFDKDVSLADIAAVINVHPSYASQIFQHEVGTGFLKYLTAVRVNHSKDLLRDTELTVQDIGNRVGYVNVHTFIRAFKKNTGLTPKEFRTTQRANSSCDIASNT